MATHFTQIWEMELKWNVFLFQVNWSADVSLEDLALGKLPVVQVPKHVKDHHFCQVSYQGAGGSVDTSFIVVYVELVNGALSV